MTNFVEIILRVIRGSVKLGTSKGGRGQVAQRYFPAEFKSRKAAQIAAYFTQRKGGIEKMALIKLMYLAERAFIEKHGAPMLYDDFVSMEHGPICSSSLNGINYSSDYDVWPNYIHLTNNKDVTAIGQLGHQDFDELSRAEWKALEDTWEKFGHMSAHQLRKYTHKHCPEYKKPKSPHKRHTIEYEKLLEVLGVPGREAILKEIDEAKRVQKIR